MATRITNLMPACGYTLGGISSVRVLDYDDFAGFEFNGGLYNSCLITDVQRRGDFADVQAKTAKYSGPYSNKIVSHTLETFVEGMGAAIISAAHLATRRRYIVIFNGMDGKPYAFGYDAGATATYNGQTEGAQGLAVTFTASSVYPLFEVTPEALENTTPVTKWLPDFINGAYCEVK